MCSKNQQAHIGDKVCIRRGAYQGLRGCITSLSPEGAFLDIGLGAPVVIPYDELQNYSAAARLAWKTRPDRSVGRPKYQAPRKRMISLRLDIDLIDALARAVDEGYIPNKEAAVNRWLRDKLSHLFADIEHNDLRTDEQRERTSKGEING